MKNSDIRRERPQKKSSFFKRVLIFLLVIVMIAGAGAAAGFFVSVSRHLPDVTANIQPNASSRIYDDKGRLITTVHAEENRIPVPITQVPQNLQNAFVAAEDVRFYEHHGIDPRGILRAVWSNVITHNATSQGGSTITQQYAERYYMGETTSYVGKAREAIMAIKIAQTESKDEVLCNYMNTIYLGRNSYGIQAAAKAYFNKDAKDLTLSEAAMIAGIIPSPSTWDPADNADMAKSRFKRVLNIMQEDGYITAKQHTDAKFPQTAAVAQQNEYAGPNGYLLDMVRRELVQSKAFTKEDLDTGGYKIITTIDKSKQDLMQSIGDTRLDDMPESLQIGGIALDPKTGEVLSVYAGSDYLSKQLNNADQAVFEPGSTMKPFALLGAAQSGVSFDTLFNGNSHQHFTGLDQEVNNALENNWGNINLYQATANSVNTVFMNVNEHLTPKRTAAIAHEAGIQGDIDENSMYNVLGINALTVWDLAQGHSTIANNGVKNTLHMVSKVLDSNNKDMYNAPSNGTKVFDANDCALVQKAMQGTTTYGTAAGVSARLGRQVAGKSGTANDEKAASFVGYTPQLLNVWAIWNPAEDGSAQEVPPFAGYGVSSTGYPSHLFEEFMSLALQNQEVMTFTEPTDNGKIGGPDGTWGTGAQKTETRQNQETPKVEENTEQTTPDPTQNSDQNSAGNGDGGDNSGNSGDGGDSGNNGGDSSGDGGNGGNSSGDNSGDDQSNGAQ
mgnify:CR=1 FL=1